MEPKAAQEATRHTDAQPAIRGFIDTANELDQILAEAEARRDAGEVPKDLWLCVLILGLDEVGLMDRKLMSCFDC